MKKNAETEAECKTGPEAAHVEPSGAPEQAFSDLKPDTGKADAKEADDTASNDGHKKGPAKAAEKATETPDAAKADEKAAKGPDLSARVAELEKLNAELQDQYLRKAADFDNYRKRMIREKQDAIDFANTNLLVDLVKILDDFDRAIAAVGTPEAGSPAAAFLEGTTMIRTQMGTMLATKYGLSHYPVKGEPFDPTIHEAISSLPSPDVKEPTVLDEFVPGYKLKDRVIRVAKVSVRMPEENKNQ
jgi:molecular chaperone GrpE